ncbi:hypothetical protein Q2T42_19515 [Leptolyngbya boryana CZ1]|uniref:Holin n=1 Tax=Leptolyngbya boryana CZ1 TaxID=3060204 RepID=A0AA96WQD8_LEPBY|nr:hypothetical protein [Leptolyngbya boryana]WNZ44025.1 hypothetical protein Q2T42_19515 [Leptolyngbya boryana CZ1]
MNVTIYPDYSMQTSNSPSSIPSKSMVQSKTIWGAVLTAIASIAPLIAKSITAYQNTGKTDLNDIAQMVVILATTALTIIGRIDASAVVYTPDGMPGANKPKN